MEGPEWSVTEPCCTGGCARANANAPARQVWYEWAVTEPSVGPVNNVNGRSFSIGL